MNMTWEACAVGLAVATFESWRWRSWTPTGSLSGTASLEIPDPPLARVSFLVPAWNGALDIEDFVSQFRTLSLPSKELIVCAGGDDASWETAARLADSNVVVLRQMAGEGKQRALAKCWAAATGEYVYLTDIDCWLEDHVVLRLLAPLESGCATVTTGGTVPVEADLAARFVRCRAAIDREFLPTTAMVSTGLDGRNAALTRGALERIRGFSAEAPSGTDYTLAQELRASGQRILFVPHAAMRTRYAHGMATYIRQRRRWLRNVFRLSRKYGVTEDIRHSAITVLLAYGGLLGLVAGLVWNHWLVAVLATAAAHILIGRLGYQKRAGSSVDGLTTLAFMSADLVAVLEVGFDLLTGSAPW